MYPLIQVVAQGSFFSSIIDLKSGYMYKGKASLALLSTFAAV